MQIVLYKITSEFDDVLVCEHDEVFLVTTGTESKSQCILS